MENHYKVHGKTRLPALYLWKPRRNSMIKLTVVLMERSFGRLIFLIGIEKA
jgi:hypothetical protein